MSASDQDRTLAVGARSPQISSKDDLVTRVTLARRAGKLIIIAGPSVGTVFELQHSSNLIGRDAALNQIVLADDRTVHREPHAALECQDGVFILHDMQHNNRVEVNGRQIDGPTQVRFGDEITIGATLLKLAEG